MDESTDILQNSKSFLACLFKTSNKFFDELSRDREFHDPVPLGTGKKRRETLGLERFALAPMSPIYSFGCATPSAIILHAWYHLFRLD
jgi:hypothetical protein